MKCRTNPKDKYPTYMLSLDKWLAGMNMHLFGGLPFVLVVQWSDCIGFLKCVNAIKHITIDMGGRKDRNDSQDIEPVVYIPTNLFKVV